MNAPATSPFPGARKRVLGAGGALVLLGLVAIIGWVTHQPALIRVIPGGAAMPYSTAGGFVLVGLALILGRFACTPRDGIGPPVRTLAPSMILAGLLTLLGLLALTEWRTGLSLGLHPDVQAVRLWFGPADAHMGRMRPLAALAFISIGAVLWMAPPIRCRRAPVAAYALALAVFSIGAFGAFVPRSGRLGSMLAWFAGPALAADVGLMLCGLGLFWLLRLGAEKEPDSVRHDGRRIGAVSTAIILTTGVAGVASGFAALYPLAVGGIENSLALSLKSRCSALETAIEQGLHDSRGFASQPLRVEAMRALDAAPSDASARAALQTVANTYRQFGFTAVLFRDARGAEIARAGRFVNTPELRVALDTQGRRELLWRDGYVLRSRIDMTRDGIVVGSLETERSLPLGTELHDTGRFGPSLDFQVCAPAENGAVMRCFPFRSSGWKVLRTLPDRFAGEAIPMRHALDGKTGIVHTLDYRGIDVIAAYQPVSSLGLGAVLKLDTTELFAPIARRFEPLLALLFMLGAVAVGLLHFQVMPLVRRMTREIEERETAEAGLKHSRAQLVEITATLGEGVYVLDEHGVVTFANPEAERLLGWSAAEIVGRNAHDTVHCRRPDGTPLPLDQCPVHNFTHAGRSYHAFNEWLQRKDGSFIPVSLVAAPIIRDGEVKGAVTSFSDITEHLEHDRALHESEQRFRRFFEQNSTVMLLADPGTAAIIAANQSAVAFYGYPATQLVGMDMQRIMVGEATHADTPDADGAHVLATHRLASGETREVEMHSTPVVLDGGDVRFYIVHDITERRRAELGMRTLTRALRLISECNSKLVHAEDERSLLDAICRLTVETGGYVMAWVGFARHDADQAIAIASRFGRDDDYLDNAAISWGDNAHGQGPTGTAIRTGVIQVNQDFAHNPRMEPWRDAALARGYRASVALPLATQDEVFGTLTIYAGEANAFGPEEVELLGELADDLAYGIMALRSRAARHQAEENLLHSEQRNRLILENAADAVFVTTPEGRYVYANQQASRMLRYDVETLLAMNIVDTVPPGDAEMTRELVRELRKAGQLRAEIRLMARDGEAVPVELNAVLLPDGTLYGACRDITDQKRYQAQLEYQATHDPLTGLPNRTLLSDRMEQSIVRARRTGRKVATMLIDLDRFKLVNDSLGHDLGDAMLREVAERLGRCMRSGDTVARLGGDEFMIVLPDMESEDGAAPIARNLTGALSRPMTLGGHELVVTASIGVSVYPRDGVSAPELFKNADVAMYRAKELGRNSFQFYAPEMNARMLERLELENSLRRALENDELALHYQPKVDLRQGRVVGAEALLRWQHPRHGMVSPAAFIPLAEETGLIVPIGEWVIETVAEQIQAWREEGMRDMAVSVNVSARQFHQGNLAQVVEQALRLHGIEASQLDIEVTESVVMGDPERTVTILHDLKKIGVSVSLDDFGTGYSSLNHLKRFPIDCLKIDQSFVRDITTDPDDAAIAGLVISLAHTLKQTVVAEGVETEAQLRFLQRRHCDQMQGYLFSPPLPPGEFGALVREGRRLEISGAPPTRRTLLIVDDEAGVLSSLKRLLRREGYQILTAGSAEEAMDLLAMHPVQVIISDQRMPRMSGTEFLSRVWQMYPDTVRLLLTGYTDLASVTEAINRGAILKFLTKPWDDETLKAHIRDAFSHHEAKNKAG